MPIISGKDSEIEISNTKPNLVDKINIKCGDNCKIFIKGIETISLSLNIVMKNNTMLYIGEDQRMNGVVRIFMHEPSSIMVGSSCLWSTVGVWSSDMHSIIDNHTNKRINFAEDINLGDRIWFGADSLILKGAKIGDDCVVGARSVVTRATPLKSNSLIVGNPAKVARQDIRWDRKLVAQN